MAEADRNTLVCVLTNPHSRRLFGATWAEEAKRMVAQFRAAHDLWAGDPAFVDLLERLRSGCREFAAWWDAHDIRALGGRPETATHPKKGTLQLRICELSGQ